MEEEQSEGVGEISQAASLLRARTLGFRVALPWSVVPTLQKSRRVGQPDKTFTQMRVLSRGILRAQQVIMILCVEAALASHDGSIGVPTWLLLAERHAVQA